MDQSRGQDDEPAAFKIPHIAPVMKLIHDFHDQAFLYFGGLSHYHRREYLSTSPPTTKMYLVGESRRRISEIVRYLKKKQADVESESEIVNDGNLLLTKCQMDAARRGLKRNVVRLRLYFARKGMRFCSSRQLNMMDAAARSGSLSLLTYLSETEFLPTGKLTMVEAVHAPNSVEVVQWLLARDCLVPEEAEEEAAKIGNVEVLRVFRYRPFSPGGFGQKVMAMSGLSGSIETVNYLRGEEGGCLLTPYILVMAAMKGHLELIQHVKTLGVAWDDRICLVAAYFGHLNVIRWVRSQTPPCPWDSWTLRVALNRNHKGVVQFCLENDCPRF